MLVIVPINKQMKHRILNYYIWSLIIENMYRAPPRMTKLAADVKPFLLLMRRSLLLSIIVIELTIDICDICTEAHPMLNTAGIVKYHAFFKPTLPLVINLGYEKIPKKVGITSNIPKIYQGIRFPQRVLLLSLRIPTTGVIKPSANYPESIEPAVTVLLSPTTFLIYHVK